MGTTQMNYHSRKHNVLEHLINYGDITRAYAVSVFKAQNIAQIVAELRHIHGISISTKKFLQENGMKIAVYELPYYEKNHAREVLARV